MMKCPISLRCYLATSVFCLLVSLHCATAFVFSPMKSTSHHTYKLSTDLRSAQRNRDDRVSFSDRLVECLDLVPLFEEVSLYAATNRGRQAILQLVNIMDLSHIESVSSNGISRRQAALAESVSSYSSPCQTQKVTLPKSKPILSIAKTVDEANAEYRLISEAMKILKKSDKSALPPIYGGTSPWDKSIIDTDDDEWLPSALSGYASSMDLQSILQADKVCTRLVEVQEWAHSSRSIALAPEVSRICQEISVDQLRTVLKEIGGTVQIVRKRTLFDPSGNKSFSFQLDESKFPALRLLREKERETMADLKGSIQQLLQNKKFASKVEKVHNNGENIDAFEVDGRMVVSTKQSAASSIGVVRGSSETKGTCYVEPKGNVEKGDELAKIRDEITVVENQILNHQVSMIVQAAPFIDFAIDLMARVDSIFARAAFGCILNGAVPIVHNDGVIDVKDFVNPVIATRIFKTACPKGSTVVPIDLRLSGDLAKRSLIISGPNGGGKTLALKSFGVASILTKVGVPISLSPLKLDNIDVPRVDFFSSILVEVGDRQNVDGGESTLMARLNSYSQIIHRISPRNETEQSIKRYPLILLDELGGGTDPEAGSALARATLEEILRISKARIVATTHSPQLKTMSMDNDLFSCAAVLLEREAKVDSVFKSPTFRLQYDIIGDSYALGAASRCIPSLPANVLDRVAELMTGEKDNGDTFRAMMTSLEREKDAAEIATRQAKIAKEEMLQCRNALVSLSQAHEAQLSRIENRLNSIFADLKKDETRSAYDLIGDTLVELRIVKKKIATKKEKLAEGGLKMIPFDYQFKEGESVVIIAEGEFNGHTATVASQGVEQIGDGVKEVAIIPSFEYEWGSEGVDSGLNQPKVFNTSDLALWNYPDDLNWEFEGQTSNTKSRSVSDAKRNLFDTLKNLSPSDIAKGGAAEQMKPLVPISNSKYKSSRERKAATTKAKKEKQRSKGNSRRKKR